MKTPLEDLQDICETIQERWDADMRSGKLLLALMGDIPNYDPRVTRIRNLLGNAPASTPPPYGITTPRADGAALCCAFTAGDLPQGITCQSCHKRVGPREYHECWSTDRKEKV